MTENVAGPRDDIELTVLMPCLNEAETLATCILKAQGFLGRHSVSGEVLIADNGSTDGSQAIASECGARVVAVVDKGYGAALQGGIRAARGKYIIMGDADDSYDFTALELFLDALRSGSDLVMGNRFRGGIKAGAMPPLHRYLGNPVLSFMGRLFFRSGVRDFHCGLRGFRKQAAEKMDLQTMGMEFASEMVVKATLLGLKVTEVPTTLSPDGRSRPPHLRSWRDGWRHLRFLLLYSPRWLFLYPGLLLMIAGIALVTRLYVRPVAVGSVVLDIHTMLFAATGATLGFQAVLFAILSRAFAVNERLLPDDARFRRFSNWYSLEKGLLTGGGLVLAGLAVAIWSTFGWGETGFGELEPRITMRGVIVSVLLMTMGAQVLLGSFFWSILGLKRRRH